MAVWDLRTMARGERLGWAPSRILSAIGHPGYSDAFAAAVLARMTGQGLDAFGAIAAERWARGVS